MERYNILILLTILSFQGCKKDGVGSGVISDDETPLIAGSQQPKNRQQKSGQGVNPAISDAPDYSMAVNTIADVPKCNKDRDRQLIYVIEEKKFLTCNSTAWAEITIAGEQGVAGATGAQGDQGVQGATGAGAPGPRGPAGGSGLMVYDGGNAALGQLVSTVNPYNGQPGSLTIYDQLYGLQYVLNPNGGLVSPTNTRTYYGNADCTGARSAYADNYQTNGLFSFFWEDSIVEMTSLAPIVSKSFHDYSGGCFRVLGADPFGMISSLNPGTFDISVAGLATHAVEIVGTSVIYRSCLINCKRPSDWSEIAIYNGNAYNPAIEVEGSTVSIVFSRYSGQPIVSHVMRAHCAENCTAAQSWTIDDLESVSDWIGTIDYSIEGGNQLIGYTKQAGNGRSLQALLCSGNCDTAANWNGVTVSTSSLGINGIRVEQIPGLKGIQYTSSERMYHSSCSSSCESAGNWSTAEVAYTPNAGGFVWQQPVPLSYVGGVFYTAYIRYLGNNANGGSYGLVVATCPGSCGSSGSWQETQIATGQNWWAVSPELKTFAGKVEVFYAALSGQNVYQNSMLATCASDCSVAGNWTHVAFGDLVFPGMHNALWQLEASADKTTMVWFSGNGDRYAECTTNCDTAEGWYGNGYGESRAYPIQASDKIQSSYAGPLRIGDIQ